MRATLLFALLAYTRAYQLPRLRRSLVVPQRRYFEQRSTPDEATTDDPDAVEEAPGAPARPARYDVTKPVDSSEGPGFNQSSSQTEAPAQGKADALEVTPADTVLEIGYGLGFSCAAIQRRKPRRHVVVECDANVRARIPDGVEVVAATWQAYLADANDNFPIHEFSAVFFDDFPIVATPSRGSRWRSFLEALVPHIAWAAPPRRVVGYCCDAERLRAALPDGYWLERATPFELTPPADCPYVSEAAGDRCFVVVIGFDATGVYEPGA